MGSQLPEIVLLPGLDGTGEMFARIEARLHEVMRTTAVRYPDDPTFAYRDYVEYAKGVIGSRPVFLLGESFSGPVAIAVADALGEQVRGLVLSATFVRPPWPVWLIRRSAGVDPTATPVAIRDWVLMGRHQDEEMKRTVQRIVETLPRPVRNARLLAVAGVDARADFERLRCPILALHGTGDWLVPKRSMQRAVARKQGAAMALISGAHMLLQTRSEQAALHIASFVRGIDGRNQETDH